MVLFETILVMLTVAVVLIAIAERLRVPYPAILALGGAVVAAAGIDVGLHPEPELMLALLVAPALLDAAYDFSLRELKRNWRGVFSLAVVAVALTTLAVAGLVHFMAPGVPWAAAIALGAIVAPPDAVAATTVLRDVKAPHRVAVILEGEALLNDASALLIYRLAVVAMAAGGSLDLQAFAPTFLLSLVGSVVAGAAIAVGWRLASAMIPEGAPAIIMQFVTTYAVWIIAERLELSPILTVVAYAMVLSRWGAVRMPARMRLPSYAVWGAVVPLVNIFAFGLIGLELAPLLRRASRADLVHWGAVAAAVLATIIVVRSAWTLLVAWIAGLRARHQPDKRLYDGLPPGWRTGLLVGWAGSRGIVTVATALALPDAFPERGMLLFTAFTVTLGTLLLQGLTLRPLVAALGVRDDSPVERETRMARARSTEAAIAALAGETGEEAQHLRASLIAERDFAAQASSGDGRPVIAAKALHERALNARRRSLLALRDRDEIGDETFQSLEQELDVMEMAIATRR